jgi:hypothetical protein
LFFIVPIGAIIIGAIAGMGYPSAIESYNKKRSKVNTYTVITLAVVTFVLLQFMYYKMKYLTADMSMNFHFEGEHISKFVVSDTNQPMTFINFLQLKIETSTISFTRRVVKPIFSVSENSS